ncbi:MAG: hypothetical protein V1746_05595 [bacterium]
MEAVYICNVGELEKDEAFFQKELPKLLPEAGKYALIFKQKLIGIFPTYQEALSKGYELAGLETFLVQQISQIPQVQQFSRVVGFECLTSH